MRKMIIATAAALILSVLGVSVILRWPGSDHITSAKPPLKSPIQKSAREAAIIFDGRKAPADEQIAQAPTPIDAQSARINKEAKAAAKEYRRFLAQSTLSQEQKDALMLLSAKRSLLIDDREEDRHNGRFKTQAEAQQFYLQQNNELDQQMRGLLGSEYGEYWRATEEIPMQRLISAFSRIVKNNDLPISQEDQDLLVDVVWAENKKAGVDPFYSPVYSIVTPKALALEAQKRALSNENIIESAQAFLSPSQLERLKTFQDQQIQGMFYRARYTKSPAP